MPIQAILFDYGVVLSGPPNPVAWARMLAITGLPDSVFSPAYWAPRHDYDRGFHTGLGYWRAVGHHAGLSLSEDQVRQLIAADNDLWTGVNQPMLDWVHRLQAAKTPTAVLSNLGDSMTEGVLAAHPWLAGFDLLLWSYTLKLAKPDPEIYRHAVAGLGLAPAEILFIDDRADNVQGGLDAGMQVIFYTLQAEFESEMRTRDLTNLWQTGRLSATTPAT